LFLTTLFAAMADPALQAAVAAIPRWKAASDFL
jgi:hypothetical protein